MKRLICGIGAILSLAACNPKSPTTSTTAPKPPPPAQGSIQQVKMMTLDGRTKDEAAIVVDNFTDDNSSSHNKTNIWFSDKWVKEVRNLLESEKKVDPKVDGFRIYFAKDNKKNTLTIVSTKEIGANANAPSKKDHKDYFEHVSPYLDTLRQNTNSVNYLIDYHPLINAAKGTRLYKNQSPCNVNEDCSISVLNHHISCGDAYIYVNKLKKNKGINVIAEWFPLELLQALDAELDSAKAKQVASDGIRMYFVKKAKRNAFIIVTTENKDGGHTDYYKCYNSRKKDIDDHGEECPLNCSGLTWPEADPAP